MQIIKALACIVLLACVAALGSLTWAIVTITERERIAEAQINARLDKAEAAVQALLAGLDKRSDEALQIVRDVSGRADRQLTGARADVRAIAGKLDAPLAALSDGIQHVAGIREDLREELHDVQPALSNVAHITAQLDQALPETTASLNATLAAIAGAAPRTSAAVEGIAESVDKAAPSILRAVNRITKDASFAMRVTVKAKPPWYLRIFGIGRHGRK